MNGNIGLLHVLRCSALASTLRKQNREGTTDQNFNPATFFS